MKHIRTALSVLLCLALCFALCCTAFASEEASNEAAGHYGYTGEADTANAEDAVNLSSGEMTIDGEVIYAVDGSAIQNSSDSVLVVRNSYVEADSSASTEPLTGNPGNLLVAGSVRATLALSQAHSFYINSTIIGVNWAALSTDGAEPVTEDGQSELSLFTYGTYSLTREGGYGAYSDLFCNLLVYGSDLEAAEIGIISGTYGRVVVGTIADGEADPDVSAVLTEDDMAAQPDKDQGSIIAGGRNAIMIHSVNLPPYWEYEGYSEEELPLHSTSVTVNNSVMKTDSSLDQNVAYDAQKQAYIDHCTGSVILIKSTNTDINLTNTQLIADENGTGAIIHSVYNNDTGFMNAVPDGEQYPGMVINMNDMAVSGDVIDEDYQRDMYLNLSNSSITGAINYYDCAHWNEVAAAEGFTDYALDASYETVHGTSLSLTNGSVWTVTGDSTLLSLTVDETSSVEGVVTVDGEVVDTAAGGTWTGVITVSALS